MNEIVSRLPKKPLLSIAEISAAMGFASDKSVRNAINSGTLRAIPLGLGKKPRKAITYQDAVAYVALCQSQET